jgi:ABC-2 type transport system permease protein
MTAPALAVTGGGSRESERGLRVALRDGAIVAGRNLRVAGRSPRVVASASIFPLIFFFGFLAVLRRSLDARGIDYEQYLPPIVLLQAMFFTGLSSAAALADDRAHGLLERCRSLPISRWAPIVGRVASDLTRSAGSVAVLLVASAAVGFRFHAGAPAAVAFVALTLLFAAAACAGFGSVALVARDPEATLPTLALPYLLLLMLSTGFVPQEGFPGWLQPIVRWQPVSLTAEALRALADGGPTARPLLRAAVALVVLIAVFATLAAHAYRRPR